MSGDSNICLPVMNRSLLSDIDISTLLCIGHMGVNAS